MATRFSTLVVAVIVLLVASSLQLVIRAQECGPAALGNKCYHNTCCSKDGYCGGTSSYCGTGCQPAYGECNSGCFPGDAIVLMRDGIEKPISKLSIGDEVAVWINKNGELQYDEVYVNGHTDSLGLSEFISITLRNGNATKKLQLTADHFVPVVISKGKMQYRKAKDVVIGDKMMAIDDEQGLEFIVIGLEKEMLRGLFNPFTMHGTILVNNVIASCHSDWFLDSTFDRIGLSHLLPSTYQAILTPIRMIYKYLGSDAYKSLYIELDTRYNIAKSGSQFIGYLNLLQQALPSSIKGARKHT